MIKIYPNGAIAYCPQNLVVTPPEKREVTKGWTQKATRNHTRFLYSVNNDKLTGYGYAYTLTVKGLPPTPKDWAKIRDTWLKRCRRLNLIRYHWLTEWQRRGVPHLHGCLYFESPLHVNDIRKLIAAWCEVASAYGAKFQAQDFKPITDQDGWSKYLSKHASRGVGHYQRANKPADWINTGRVWGHGGDWPVEETVLELPRHLYAQFRRLVKRWRLADSRIELPVDLGGLTISPDSPMYRDMLPNGFRNGRRIRSARRLLKCNDKALSSVRGVSEWINQTLCLRMVEACEMIHQHKLNEKQKRDLAHNAFVQSVLAGELNNANR